MQANLNCSSASPAADAHASWLQSWLKRARTPVHVPVYYEGMKSITLLRVLPISTW